MRHCWRGWGGGGHIRFQSGNTDVGWTKRALNVSPRKDYEEKEVELGPAVTTQSCSGCIGSTCSPTMFNLSSSQRWLYPEHRNPLLPFCGMETFYSLAPIISQNVAAPPFTPHSPLAQAQVLSLRSYKVTLSY